MTSAAYHALGEMLFYGEGGAKQSYSEAFEHYLKAAQKKYRLAQIQVGVMYENGQGVTKNIDLAADWYTKAEKGGNATAQHHLGSLWEDLDIDEAILWHQKSAEQGSIDSQKALKRLKQIKDNTQKENEFIEAYDQGKHGYVFQILSGYVQNNDAINPRVYHIMGRFYHLGEGGVAKNFTEAMKWYLKAAEQKYANSYVNVGVMYENGEGVVRSNSEAVKWYRKAAWQGNETAKQALKHLGYSEY